jgi:uncharacterized protein YjbI with pentapeptide repeats
MPIPVDTLSEILRLHKLWLFGSGAGRRAQIAGADLSGADLSGALLSGANLSDTILRSANLSGAILSGTILSGADLWNANLSGANLMRASLSGAILSGANLSGAFLPHFQVAPEKGSFTAWKAVQGAVLELHVPTRAKRTSSLIGRKIRVSEAKVVKAYGSLDTKFVSLRNSSFVYHVGEYVYPDSYDDDIRVECTHGIHCFITQRETEELI